MELVIGGAFQGKLTWALSHYGLTEADVCDLARTDPIPHKRCYWHLEALSRRCEDMTPYLPLFENAVVITRLVGGGIVPMDGEERAWRERHGVLVQRLAERAGHVTHVLCGLTEELK